MKKSRKKTTSPEREILHQTKDGRGILYRSLPDDPHLQSGWMIGSHPALLKFTKPTHGKDSASPEPTSLPDISDEQPQG